MIIKSTLKLKSFNNYSLKKTEVFIKEKAKLLDLTFNAKQLQNKSQ